MSARRKGGNQVHRILYVKRIRKRGLFGIPYTGLVVRAAHVDEANWRRLRHRPFSMEALMGCRT